MLDIEIEGDTQDGSMYNRGYADRIKITFTIHKNQRYYEILTLYRLDKSVHYQGEIKLTDSDHVCLNGGRIREVGKLERFLNKKEMFSQDMIDFWTKLFDNIFFY